MQYFDNFFPYMYTQMEQSPDKLWVQKSSSHRGIKVKETKGEWREGLQILKGVLHP